MPSRADMMSEVATGRRMNGADPLLALGNAPR
jgi:hypothetical protein